MNGFSEPKPQRDPRAEPAPVLFALPLGLLVSGITTWALRLAGALAHEGRRVAIIAHDEPPAFRGLTADVPPGVRLIRLPGAPPLERCERDLSPFIPTYRGTIRRLADESGRPVVCCPNLSLGSYGIFAALAAADPEPLRTVAWTHNHVEHDLRMTHYYEPILSGILGVSRAIADSLRQAIPWRAHEIIPLPHGVSIAPRLPERPPLNDRPLRLVYTGRMDHTQKRIGALLLLSSELASRNVPHELILIGDGPASPDVDAFAHANPFVRRLTAPNGGPLDEPAIARILARTDLFVLASRYEGLCVSMLEAMGQGCIPVVTQVSSGAQEAIEHGVSGLCIPAPVDDERAVAKDLADAIAALTPDRIVSMRKMAWAIAGKKFSTTRHMALATDFIDRAAAAPARWWPPDRPLVPSSIIHAGAHAFSVPPDACARAAAALDALRGRAIALWGAGRHTIAIAPALADANADLRAIIDDDPARRGTRLWGIPIGHLRDAAQHGVTDVLISSWMHEQEIWSRRDETAALGMRLHRIYNPAPAHAPDTVAV